MGRPRFLLKKLPPHWQFVPSKRQVRELLAQLDADMRLVEFFGTGSGQRSDWLSLGFVESRVEQAGWCFYIRLWGIRETTADSAGEKLAETAVADIKKYIRGCLRQPPSAVTKPAQLILSYHLEAMGITSKGRVKEVGRYSFPTPSWWENAAD